MYPHQNSSLSLYIYIYNLDIIDSCCTVPGAVRESTLIVWRMERDQNVKQKKCSGFADGVQCVTCVVLLVLILSSGAQTAGIITTWSV